ncbi:MAG: hypothetical protein NZ703_10460, partial [Gemmataceae bacterium]|nr:hypothetical protein [Gemmataceae bacterium]
RLLQALTYVKPGVAIDRRSGAARPEHLRFEEVCRKGMILEALAELEVSNGLARELASALLIAATRLVERLGGKRRRGLGRCRLEIPLANVDTALRWLQTHERPPEIPPVISQPVVQPAPQPCPAHDPWLVVPLRLRLLSPLACSFRTVGNVIETLSYLPGTALLPHVSNVLRRYLDPLQAIRRGELQVLNATLEIDGHRSWPNPLAWFYPKGHNGINPDDLVNRLVEPEMQNVQLKQVRDRYTSPVTPCLRSVPITSRTHNTIEDSQQRPSEQVGGVYTYEAIAPWDQGRPVVLRSEIRLRQSLVRWLEQQHASHSARKQAHWWEELNDLVPLGRSSKDDYGEVELRAEPPRPLPENVDPVRDDHLLYVWLLSDCLIRNDHLAFDPTPQALVQELARLLNAELKLRQHDTLLSVLVRTSRLESWHSRWHLPRPSLVGLKAGSCLVIEVVSNPEGPSSLQQRLQQIQAAGIGSRTAEGYGQICFNHPFLTHKSKDWPATAASVTPSGNLSSDSGSPATDPLDEKERTWDKQMEAFARLLEEECWKQEIRRACLAIAADASQRKNLLGWDAHKGQPPMSQLGALRDQLALLSRSEHRQRILDWLQHLQGNKRRSEKWPALPKLRDFLQTPERVWAVLRPETWPTLTAQASVELKQKLWSYAVRTFFDACIRAHKRDLESRQAVEDPAHGP